MAEGAVSRIQVTLIGDEKVGKTSLVKRYTKNTFSPDYESTVGKEMVLYFIRMTTCT